MSADGEPGAAGPSDRQELRFFCDEMLARLARWLRAAGHDAALAEPGMADGAILAQCAAEKRVLLTRDRHLVQAAARRGRAVLLPDRIDDQAALLAGSLGVDWMRAPFTRCIVDNAPLRPASVAERDAIPAQSRALPGPFRTCPACGRVFWPGSHARRMGRRLGAWRERGAVRRPSG